MFGIGMPEMILILAVALIVIGPKKLPDLAKSLGRALGEFKRATTDFKESMELDNDIKGVRDTFDEIKETADITSEFDSKTQAASNSPYDALDEGDIKEKKKEKIDITPESENKSQAVTDSPADTDTNEKVKTKKSEGTENDEG